MQNCKKCKWWGQKQIHVEYPNHRECLSPNLMPCDVEKGNLDTLLYYDEGSKFWSGPDFGCIHWRKKGGFMSDESKKGVVVTTSNNGVFFGYLNDILEKKPESLTLSNARNCVFWSGETKGFLGLASLGPQEGSRIGPMVPNLTIYGITSIAVCTPQAIKKWEKGLWK